MAEAEFAAGRMMAAETVRVFRTWRPDEWAKMLFDGGMRRACLNHAVY